MALKSSSSVQSDGGSSSAAAGSSTGIADAPPPPGRRTPGLLRPLRCVMANLSAFAAMRKETAALAGTVSSPPSIDGCRDKSKSERRRFS